MDGDLPMAELDKELWAYSIQGRWELQEVGCLAVMVYRARLASSVWLLDWG